MKVAIVAPSSVPFVIGGAERLWNGLVHRINEDTPHDAELVKLPTPERNLPDLVASYRAWARLDVTHFDLVISTKYPAWMVDHNNHVVYLQHTLRGLYDTYPAHLGPFMPDEPELVALQTSMQHAADREGVLEVMSVFDEGLAALGPGHAAFAFPGPLARELVHTFDRVALAPTRIRRHLAISATVAARRDYFPPGAHVEVVRHPSDLDGFTCRSFEGFFTASRLEPPKRIDLLIEAMQHVPVDVTLRIAGTGPDMDRLRELAAGDHRIELLGFVDNNRLLDEYARALAVPFVPLDEDLGLITLEAMCSGKAVLTTSDSGGPVELVVDGLNGFVTRPDARDLGAAMTRLATDPALARRLGAAARSAGAGVTWRQTVDALLRTAPSPSAPVPGRTRRRGRPRLVVTSTFPVHPRLGGGQLRCFHLYGAMTERFDIEIVSLTGPVDHPMHVGLGEGFSETVVPKTWAHEHKEAEVHAAVGVPVTDIVAGRLIEHTPAYLEALQSAAEGATAILLAHPFLLGAAELVAPDLPLIYDAHNAEFQLKASILPKTSIAAELVDEVRQIEGRAAEKATLIAVCSRDDGEALASAYRLSQGKLIEVANGVDARAVAFTDDATRSECRERWITTYGEGRGGTAFTDIALFAGSWHMPNIDAAKHIMDMAPDLPDMLFLLMGSHGDFFGRWLRTPPNVVRLGVVPESHKRLLLQASSVGLNPMARGSGTNLKIVEYFAAGVPVVSTALGARGLEMEDGTHLTLADLNDFPVAVRAVLDNPERCSAMARRARDVVEQRYDWHRLGETFAAAIAHAVAP